MGSTNENNYRLRLLDFSDDTSLVATTGTQTKQLKPDVGKTWDIVMMHIDCPPPAGGGSGTHEIEIWYDGIANDYEAKCSNVFGDPVRMNTKRAFVGTTEFPANTTQQHAVMTEWLHASNDVPINIIYNNKTNVAAALNRVMFVQVKEYREAP